MGDTHADAALGELAGCGLLSPAGSRYRLAPGVVAQLEAAGYGEDADDRARTAAQHYAWWAGHSSVTAARAVAEADAIVAAMTRLVPGDGAGQASAAVLLARSAAPALAAGLHWSGWEKTLRLGQEAARIAGEVAEEAYFHHELGVLALCNGNPDRARAELETSISMRGALADKSGAVAGRRALALVADRSGTLPGGRTPVGEEVLTARYDESASPPGGIPAAGPMVLPWMSEDDTALISRAPASGTDGFGGRKAVLGGARRNLVAAGAGVLLAAVLGTVVTLGMMPSSDAQDGGSVSTEQSAGEDDSENGLPADEPHGRLDTGRGLVERLAFDAGTVWQPSLPERQRCTVLGVERAERQPEFGLALRAGGPAPRARPPSRRPTHPRRRRPRRPLRPRRRRRRPAPPPRPRPRRTRHPRAPPTRRAARPRRRARPAALRNRSWPERTSAETWKAPDPRSAGPGPSVVRRSWSEQAELVVLDAAHGVVVEHHAADSAVRRQHPGLRLDLLRRKDALHRGEVGIAVEQLQIAGQLLHAVDVTAALQLHGHGLPVRVPAQDVDRADGGGVLAADQGVALAEDLDPVGEEPPAGALPRRP